MSFMFIPERNHDNWCKVQGLPTVSVASEIELNEIIHCDRESPKYDIETSIFARIQSIVLIMRPIIYLFPRDTY